MATPSVNDNNNEKTRLITVTPKNPATPPPAPGSPQGGRPVPPQSAPPRPAGPPSSPAATPASLMLGAEEDREKTKKKHILMGVLGASFLAGSTLLITSFKTKDETLPPLSDAQPAGGDGLSVGNSVGAEASKVVVDTAKPVYDQPTDNLTLEEAREASFEANGTDGLFVYKGQIFPNMSDNDFNSLSDDEQNTYLNSLIIKELPEADVNIEGDNKVYNVLIPLFNNIDNGSVELGSIVKDEEGTVFYLHGDGTTDLMPGVYVNEYGGVVALDSNGDEVYINPTMMYSESHEGHVDIQTYLTDPEVDPVVELGKVTYISEWIDTDGDGFKDTEVFGWDYDADGAIDVREDLDYGLGGLEVNNEPTLETLEAVEPQPVASMTDQLVDKAHEMAEMAGIEEVSKVKIKSEGEGYSMKIKSEDGDKIKVHLSKDDLEPEASTTTDDANVSFDDTIDYGSGDQQYNHPDEQY